MAKSLRKAEQRIGGFVQEHNRQMDALDDEGVSIKINAAWNNVAIDRGPRGGIRFHQGGVKAGARITQGTTPTADDVAAWVSKGETVVSAADSEDPWFQSWATGKGIPGFATGGRILHSLSLPPAGAGRWVGSQAADATADAVGRLLSKWLLTSSGGAGAPGGPGHPSVKAFIRSTDALKEVRPFR